jgi:hypothetical protein
MSQKKSTWAVLSKINVNDKVEKREGLTYLSWAWAWGIVKENFPNAKYEIVKDEFGRPYHIDPKLGIMVETIVTIGDETLPMWLPVMDTKNKAMKTEPYEYTTRYGKKSVAAASMFDVNKTLMRCLVKNIAMFGLGHYIYGGEDIPQGSEPIQTEQDVKKVTTRKSKPQLKVGDEYWEKVSTYLKSNKGTGTNLLIAQIRTKYTLPKETLQEINNILK